MVKKSLIAGLVAIILSLCCGLCFAAENSNETSVNLGNEISGSINKAGQTMQNVTDNVFSGNTANDMRNGMDNVRNGMQNVGEDVRNGIDTLGQDVTNGMNNVDNGVVNSTGTNAGNYNTTRTTAEATTGAGFATMSTTTWMWIILAVAAIIIIAAIWYYATQNND